MTIQSQTNKTIALGDGVTTQFGFAFVGVAAAYIGVIYTDASGDETVLTQGSGSNQYQIVLNPPVTGAIWGMGGTVTYAPSGAPIAVGTTLTIFRTLPLTQIISLQNQNSLASLGQGAETGLDTIEMQLQQTAETISRAIVAPIVDSPAINLQLPPAAQRANTGIAFDGQGNVIAGTTPATGLISSAMQPVVNAASLALGRAAFGLGNAATQNIGAGLQADGAGNLRVNMPAVQVASNQAVDATFDLERFIATGPITFTLTRGNTFWNGFGFWVEAFAGDVTLSPNAADTISGATGSGVPFTIPAGAKVYVTTDAATNATWYVEGMPWLVQNARSCSGTYNISRTDNAKILNHNSGAFGTFIFPAAGSLPADFRCLIVNGETTAIGKGVGGTNLGSFTMYPGQSYLVINRNGTVYVVGGKQLYIVDSVALFAANGGSDDPLVADGLALARPRATLTAMKNQLYRDFDHNGSQPSCTASGTFDESVTFAGQPINTGAFYWMGVSDGGFLWRPGGAGTPYCAIIGDGCIMIAKNIWTDGNGITSTAFQVHQNAIFDIGIPGEASSGFAFGSHGNPGGAHIATDGAGWTINISGNYRLNGAGGAAVHINALGSGVINHAGLITVTLTNTPNIGAWFRQSGPTLINLGGGVTWSGAVVAGCQKWSVGSGAVLSLAGNGANVPGSVAGSPVAGAAPTAATGSVVA